MLRKLTENTRIESSSKSGDWLIPQKRQDTRVILTNSQSPGLHTSWGKEQSYTCKPHKLEDNLDMSRFFHCTNLQKPPLNSIDALLNRNRLRLTEHFFALIPLFQIQGMHFIFPDGATPYSRTTLTQITQELETKLKETQPDGNFVTPKQSFFVKSGISTIYVEKVQEPGLQIHAEFDYTECKPLAWIGQGRAYFNSHSSNPLDFVDTPVPCMHGIWQKIFKLLKGIDFQENLISEKDIEQNPDLLQLIFNHKILDLLGALNVGEKLLAANIYMLKGSHQSHIAMRQKMQQIGLKDL